MSRENRKDYVILLSALRVSAAIHSGDAWNMRTMGMMINYKVI